MINDPTAAQPIITPVSPPLAYRPVTSSEVNNFPTEMQGYSAYAVDAADQMVLQLDQLLGYPTGMDVKSMVVFALQNGLFNQGQAGFQALYESQWVPQALKTAAPWAEFGLTKDQYDSQASTLRAAWFDLTGDDTPADVLKKAIAGGWSTMQLTQFAQTELTQLATGPGSDTSTAPWLQEGQTFTKTKQAYISTYGQAPPDRGTLASWYRFGQGSRQVGSAAEAPVAPASGPKAPAADSEIR